MLLLFGRSERSPRKRYLSSSRNRAMTRFWVAPSGFPMWLMVEINMWIQSKLSFDQFEGDLIAEKLDIGHHGKSPPDPLIILVGDDNSTHRLVRFGQLILHIT